MNSPRILIEGGPVDIRSKHILALMAGLLIGTGGGLAADTVIALRASHAAHRAISKLEDSRREAVETKCGEEHRRHGEAQVGIEALVVMLKRPVNHPEINEFVQALVPDRECKAYVPRLLGEH